MRLQNTPVHATDRKDLFAAFYEPDSKTIGEHATDTSNTNWDTKEETATNKHFPGTYFPRLYPKDVHLFENNELLIIGCPRRDHTSINLYDTNPGLPFATISFDADFQVIGNYGTGQKGKLDKKYFDLLLKYSDTPIVDQLKNILIPTD